MVDEFLLGGDGPEQLHNGFVADISYAGSIDAPFDIVARTSFGDPIEFSLRGYFLSLRDEQAENILVATEE